MTTKGIVLSEAKNFQIGLFVWRKLDFIFYKSYDQSKTSRSQQSLNFRELLYDVNMIDGAHFYRCDFQVHTPRDLNWIGPRPTTDEDRKKYAEDFITTCRERNLHAVAITDHHDISFFRFLKEAANNELDESGNSIKPENRIIVFPGMELTLGVPCQAILILDANFPPEFLSQIPTILAVSQNDASAPTHAEVKRLDHITSIRELCDDLDQRDFLKGHYILLPNVSDSGDFSILRKAFHPHYKDMPCVGGYIDGSIEKLGKGKINILQGRDKHYGFKRLGVFQTSDNRKVDFGDLGKHTTWVKWAIPTAEALRQACLAQDTRISQSEPQLPSLVIQKLEVSNSKFLGPIDITFNSQLNSLIGGRGTGKSTILEYLRWALCDQPPGLTEEDEIPDFQKKRSGLIQNTLKPVEAVTTVTFLLNDIPHVVRRNTKTKQITLKVGTGEFQEVSEETIRDLLPIQAYSQKQLSTVGVRTDELVRFIKTPIVRNLRDFQIQQEEIKRRLQTHYLSMTAKLSLSREIEKEKLEVSSLNQQVQQLHKELKRISEEDQAILTQHEAFINEEELVGQYTQAIEDWRHGINLLANEITMPDLNDLVSSDSPNSQKIAELKGHLSTLHKTIIRIVQGLLKDLAEDAEAIQKIRSIESELTEKFRIHKEIYEAAKTRSTTQESKLQQISDTEKRMRTLKDGLLEKERQLAKYGNPEGSYELAREEWKNLHATRGDTLEERCKKLTMLSEGRIRARLRRGATTEKIKDRLTAITSGTGLRTKKVEDLVEEIAGESDSLTAWHEILTELESLALTAATDGSDIEIPSCPQLKKSAFSQQNLEKIARKLSVDDWLELSLTELEDLPVFEYRQREGDYIDFADASAGQQATALLRVLLAQDGPPLIIDQPEEDLDNPVILEIVSDIWTAKEKRQIIFSSHNANIVVNGDADLVIGCDYRTAGDQSGGQIKCRGAIDMDEIRNEITSVMEGGEAAFRLRKEKYGF